MVIQIDPEFKALIPSLSSEEYSQLEQNLIKETNPNSIVLFTWNGILIDGHNRYEICQKHNIPFITTEKNGLIERDDVKIWIIQNQFGRRNINNYQRSRLALELEGLFQKRAQANLEKAGELFGKGKEQPLQISVNPIEPINTQKELSKIAKVSHDGYEVFKRIFNTNIEKMNLSLATKQSKIIEFV